MVLLIMRAMLTAGDLCIRAMELADIEPVLAIESVSFSRPWNKDHFAHEIRSPHSFPFVCESERGIAGYICLTVLFELAEILDIAVAPDVRGRGVARRLMQHALGAASGSGAQLVSLEVRSSNVPAISLYRRFGFEQCGVRPRYYDGADDAVIMEKILSGDTSCSLPQ